MATHPETQDIQATSDSPLPLQGDEKPPQQKTYEPVLVALLAIILVFPRLAVFLFNSYVETAYGTTLAPLWGFLFLPSATLAYAFAENTVGLGGVYLYLVTFVLGAIDVGALLAMTIRYNLPRLLASLKLTVTLFSLSIFLILAGTMAQVEKNMWEVLYQYFYPAFARVDVRIFFPHSFFPAWPAVLPDLRVTERFFYFPGGGLIGALMVINLASAYVFRYFAMVRVRGKQLFVGLVVLALGMLVTLLIIAAGHNREGIQGIPVLEWSTIWNLFQIGLVALWALMGYLFMTLDKARRVERWLLAFGNVALGSLLIFLLVGGSNTALSEPYLRVLWQLIQGTVAGLVLLAGTTILFGKRGGVVVVHMGIALLMFGQFMVSWFDVETRMRIEEGQTINFARDIRSTEIAVVDPSHPDEKQVTVVPMNVSGRESSFLRNRVVEDERLPFDIEVLHYHRNADLRRAREGETTPATAGDARHFVVLPKRHGSGTDVSGEVDFAAAYVRLTEKESGRSLGTYLLAQHFSAQDMPEEVIVTDPQTGEAKTYEITLRFRRDYKPYSLHLIDVRKDDYMGTSTPMNYSSLVRLVDPTRNEDRQINIWMNNPLRYAGETFYQSGYSVGPDGTEITDLQVVRNIGWMIPYVACMVVAVGLLFHFSGTLFRFLNRVASQPLSTIPLVTRPSTIPTARLADDRAAGKEGEKSDKPTPRSKQDRGRKSNGSANGPNGPWSGGPMLGDSFSSVTITSIALSLLVVLAAGTFLFNQARAPSPSVGELNLYEAGKIPVMFQGRIKPLDTIARNSLRITSNNRETFTTVDGERQPALRWLLDVITEQPEAETHPVFYIPHPEVLDTLGLKPRERYNYSVAELLPNIEEFERQVQQARELQRSGGADQLSLYQRKLMELDRRIRRFTLVSASFRPLPFPEFPTEEDFRQDREGTTQTLMQIRRLMEAAPEAEQQLMRMEPPLAVPPSEEGQQWTAFGPAWNRMYLQHALLNENTNPATAALAAVFDAYAENDVRAFNRAVANYHQLLAEQQPEPLNIQRTNFETHFNHFAPFFNSAMLYLVAGLLVLAGWFVSTINFQWSRPINWATFALILLLFAVHTYAIISRIYISGRPPVTNLYGSAVFVGWGCVLFGLVLEALFRMGIGNAVAAVAGFSTLQIAHGLAGTGDTFTVLQAVLDTQFWLATHVIIMTMGYVATFVAGFIGIMFVVGGYFTPLPKEVRRVLYLMIYGVVCFALFFNFVGTVLGGLWADDSWGRFWGWDPKENGALMIVLWAALMLHARWDKLIGERGFAVLAIGGNIVVAWSWFGVNELGVGLHSYGFTDGVLRRLGEFVASQLSIIALGLIPLKSWWSYREPLALRDSSVETWEWISGVILMAIAIMCFGTGLWFEQFFIFPPILFVIGMGVFIKGVVVTLSRR